MLAIIIESRPLHTELVRNAIKSVQASINWPICLFYCDSNASDAEVIFSEFNNLDIQSLNKPVITREEYSEILMSYNFWLSLPAEHILVFQTDSALNPNSKHKIEEFLEYDYVGAPWSHLEGRIGNGGLSLRKRSVMLRALKTYQKETHPEDLMISALLYSMNAKLPSTEIASHFSVETMFYEDPLGVHSPWLYLPTAQLFKLKNGFSVLFDAYNVKTLTTMNDYKREIDLAIEKDLNDMKCEPSFMYPISFSFPTTSIFLGSNKTRLIAPLNPYDKSTYIYDNQQDYMKMYSESWLGLSPQKAGPDCFRHLEILACRGIPLINLHDVDNLTMIHYPKNLLRLVYKYIVDICLLKFKSTDANSFFKLNLDDVDLEFLTLVQNRLYEWFLKHLTTIEMMKWVFSQVNVKPNKVLFIDDTMAQHETTDYLASMVYIGLKELCGLNCTSTHQANLMYSDYTTNINNVYGNGFNWAKILSPDQRDLVLPETEIRKNIMNHEYDLIVYGSVRSNYYLRELVVKHYEKERVLYFDGRDGIYTQENDLSYDGIHFVRPLQNTKYYLEKQIHPLHSAKMHTGTVAVCIIGNIDESINLIPDLLIRIPHRSIVFMSGRSSETSKSPLNKLFEMDFKIKGSIESQDDLIDLFSMYQCWLNVYKYLVNQGMIDYIMLVHTSTKLFEFLPIELPLEENTIYTSYKRDCKEKQKDGIVIGPIGKIWKNLFYGKLEPMQKILGAYPNIQDLENFTNLQEFLYALVNVLNIQVVPSSIMFE